MVLVGGEGPVTEDLAERGIPYRTLRYLVAPVNPAMDLLAFLEIRGTLGKLRPVLVSAHCSKAGLLGRLAAWSLNIPVIFTPHGWSFNRRRVRFPYLLLERFAATFADKIITVSESGRQIAMKFRIAPGHKLVTVRNGIPDLAQEFRAAPARQPPTLAMVARFEKEKDHALLFRVLSELDGLDWRLLLIGDGPLKSEYEKLADRLGLSPRISFLGTRDDVALQLAQSQLFVLVSKTEDFPLSILEGMRAGLPVVASDVGGVSEALLDGETGFLIPRGDARVLQNRLTALIHDPDLRAAMGSAGRTRYEIHFRFDAMLAGTLSVYQQVLSGSHGKHALCAPL